MAFLRSIAQPWIGPPETEVWDGLNIPDTSALDADRENLRYNMWRKWPVQFRNQETFRSFVRRLEAFGNPPSMEGSESQVEYKIVFKTGGQEYKDIDAFLDAPRNDLNFARVTVYATSGAFFDLELGNRRKVAMPKENSGKPFLYISAQQPTKVAYEDTTVQSLMTTFIEATKPLNRWQRIFFRKNPVIVKMTEKEYYADSRAWKVRLQSWVGSVVLALLTALITIWLGVKS